MKGALSTPHLHLCVKCRRPRWCRSPSGYEGELRRLCTKCLTAMIVDYGQRQDKLSGLKKTAQRI